MRTLFLVLLTLLLAAAGWRFVYIERDPPLISSTAAEWVDPGVYLYNARCYSLFGEWRPEQGYSLYLVPGYALLAAQWFAVFGAGYPQAVTLSILAGFALIAATAWLSESTAAASARGLPKYWAGLAAASSLLFSYVIFALQHVPKGDLESIAICSLTALALVKLEGCRSGTRNGQLVWLALLGGIGVGLAPFIKIYSALFAVAVLIAWGASYFLLDAQWKRVWRQATPFLVIGLLLSTLVWGAWLLLLLRLDAADELLRWIRFLPGWFTPRVFFDLEVASSANRSLAGFLRSNLFYRHPVETLLAVVALFRCIFSRRWNWPLLLMVVWLGVGVVALGLMIYTPLRYRTLFVPPAIVLASLLWTELASGKMISLSRWGNFAVSLVSGAVLAYIALYSLSIRFTAFHAFSEDTLFVPALFSLTLIIASVLIAGLLLPQRPLALILALALFSVALPQWWIGERELSHQQRGIARRITTVFPKAVVGGLHGVELALRTRLDAYVNWTPPAKEAVTLVVDPPQDLEKVPLTWREVERHELKRIRYTLVVAEIER